MAWTCTGNLMLLDEWYKKVSNATDKRKVVKAVERECAKEASKGHAHDLKMRSKKLERVKSGKNLDK